VIERKGLKVNIGKTKVMVSGEGGERVVSRIDPCGVCDKRVKANSVLCIGCKKWVYKRCSGVKNAVTSRVRVGWMKFREMHGVLCGRKWSVKMKGRVYRVCVRAAMVYGGETWVMRKEEECVLQRAERAMVRI
jgi:hypothetical protein